MPVDRKHAVRAAFLVMFFVCAAIAVWFFRSSGVGMNSGSRDGLSMDTLVSVLVHSRQTPNEINLMLDGAFELIDGFDKKLSMHDPSSDVSRVNASAGLAAVKVAPETFEALSSALRIAEVSGGAFDPSVGPISTLWRVGDRENPLTEIPKADEIEATLSLVGYNMVSTEAPDKIFLENSGMKLDLGGVAKGYVSGEVGDFLRANGVESAILDLGGNVLVVGGRPDGEAWRIGVQHPLKPRGEPICSVAIRDSSVITAGVYERFVEIGGKRYAHIFDPRAGRPVEGNLLSATVISDDPAVGDALSTAFMVMGIGSSKELAARLGVEAIFVYSGEDGGVEVTTTDGLEGRVVMIGNETRR
ncbi:MAG: FAD:protein FMN transferase [Synergistaceae bacterium]|jgi:thiamine biosynthesis lipoprotein|nr:FAD:protein FMN transferase [Synergistaceae bacterium]